MLKIYSKYLFLVKLEKEDTDRGSETIELAVYLNSMDIGDYEREIERLASDYCELGGWEFKSAQCLFRQPFLMEPPSDPHADLAKLTENLAEQVGQLELVTNQIGRLR